MPDLPKCPMIHQCAWGKDYPLHVCSERNRRSDGLFECPGFIETEFIDTADLPDPPEELFPEFYYGDGS
jgi:hypothetical protein